MLNSLSFSAILLVIFYFVSSLIRLDPIPQVHFTSGSKTIRAYRSSSLMHLSVSSLTYQCQASPTPGWANGWDLQMLGEKFPTPGELQIPY